MSRIPQNVYDQAVIVKKPFDTDYDARTKSGVGFTAANFSGSQRGRNDATAQQQNKDGAMLANVKPIRVKMPGGFTSEFPGGMKPEQIEKLLRGPDYITPQHPTTAKQNLVQAREASGRVISKLLGIDYDQMKEYEKQGIYLSLLPVAPGGITDQILKRPGKNARLVKPSEIIQNKGGGLNSLLIDDGGNIVHLDDELHPDVISEVLGYGTPEQILNGEREGMENFFLGKELKKHKLIRVQSNGPRDIAVEMYHPPSPHALESLVQMFEAHPNAKASYDFAHGDLSALKNYTTPAELVDKIFEIFYSK